MLARSRSFVDIKEVVERISSDDITDERHIARFEEEFCRYIGAHRCIATNQARAGLLIALKALHLSLGDEVIVQSFTFHGVLDAILDAGATPVLCDISAADFNANPNDVEKRITEKTKVIIATHLFGVPCDIDETMAIAAEHNCVLFEDCAQCLGATYNGKKVGTFGDISFFSFNYEKHLSTGQGGMLAINNRDLLSDSLAVARTYERMPLHGEKCYVYGLLMQCIANEKDTYSTLLPATFGQDCCTKDPESFDQMEDLIAACATEDDIRARMLPRIRERIRGGSGNTALQRNPITRKVLEGETARRIIQGVSRLKARFAGPVYDHVESKYLLMNSLRAIVGRVGLQSLDTVNRIRNRNAAVLIESFRDQGAFIPTAVSEKKGPVFLKYNVLNSTRYPLSYITNRARKEGYEIGNFQWPEPVHRWNHYPLLIPHARKSLSVSEYIAHHIINIPVHYYITPEEIVNMAAFLEQFGSPTQRNRPRIAQAANE